MATVNGMYMVGVSNDVRTAAGVAAGQVVDVDIELDTEPRVVAVPPDLAAALDAEPEARAVLRDPVVQQQAADRRCRSTTRRAPETRQRRIEKSVASLREGRI